jgi:CsoR family transcriptional regulator, copper-sensing transcriptional repressor
MRGYYHHRDEVLGRLKRIEGQIRGLQRLVEEDTYCIDILTQISAASSGLKRVAVQLLDDHIRNCVAESQAGKADAQVKIAEATAAVDRLLRS